MLFVLLCLVGALRLEESSTRALSLMGAGTRVPSFDSVITMLQNLVSQIETEEASDEKDYRAFFTWFTEQSEATSSSINMLSTRLQELAAVIADLAARQNNLAKEVARLNGEIDETQTQIEAAKEKRTEEHNNYVQEQLDFDNSIAACEKAVELLTKFYGDGKPKESTRPAWMSLMATVQKLHLVAKATNHPSAKALGVFLQQHSSTAQPNPGMRGSTLNTNYEVQTGDALSIVDQVKGLSSTFAEDKQSSVDQESELQENRNAEATAKATLLDEQEYLSTIKAQEADTTAMYNQRMKDRAEEKKAVNMAMTVLNQENPTFLQRHSSVRSKVHSRNPFPGMPVCRQCQQASLFLRQRAS